jgi:hypothetical protein
MTPGWVGGVVRARLLARRRLGAQGARRVALAGPREAVAMLAESPYGRNVDGSMDRTDALHAAAETTLWHLRILAGWLGPRGTDIVRVVAGWFEIMNTERKLDLLLDRPTAAPWDLGALEVAWKRTSRAGSPVEIRRILTASPWGDPGGTSPAELGVGMRLAWARRMVESVPPAGDWATAGAAIVLARESLLFGRSLNASAEANAARVLGHRWIGASCTSPAQLAELLPQPARTLLAEIESADQLWQVEGTWRRRVESDALGLLRRSGRGPEVVAAAAVLLIIDLWRVQGALEATVWGEQGMAVFDAVA